MLDIKAKHASCQGMMLRYEHDMQGPVHSCHCVRVYLRVCLRVCLRAYVRAYFRVYVRAYFKRVFNSDVWHDTGRYEQDMRGRVDACRAVTSFTKILAAFPQVSISAFGVQGFGFGV